jgi:hypothetical protein
MVGFVRFPCWPLLTVLAAWAILSPCAHAQGEPVQVDWQTVVQQYDVDPVSEGLVSGGMADMSDATPDPLRQVATSLVVRVPIGERWRASLRAQAAQTGDIGTDRPGIGGLDDLLVSGSYTQPLGAADLVIGLTAALPTGKETLTDDQLTTAVLLSRDVYAVPVSGYGQGLRVAPSLALAVPVADGVVVGLSGTANFYGTYTPVADMPDPYGPGPSAQTSVGVDVLLTPTSALSGDVGFTTYGTDTVGGVDQLTLGNRWSATVQYLNRFGFNEFRARLQFEERSRSTLFEPIQATGDLAASELRLRPRESFALASFRVRLREDLFATASARGSWFRETTQFDQALVGQFLLRPEVQLTDRWTLTARVQAALGDVTGVGGGLGLSADL